MNLDPADVALCVADDGPPDATGAAPASTPIVQTSLFAYPDFRSLAKAMSAEHRNHVYSRGQNPTVEAAERKLAALERGEACKCFASGMGAVSAVLLGLLESGDHVVFVNQVYGPTLQLADQLRRFGITHDVVLDTDMESVERALTSRTKLIWLESPGTMLFRMVDLAALASLARSRGILTCIDNTWATPLLQKPIEHGIDIVVHTATKYIGGHSDLMAGAVVSSTAVMETIFTRSYMLVGAILSPMDAWLMLRGLRTLPVRLAQHESDGIAVAGFLRAHPRVRRVFHPMYEENQDLVARYLRGFSGVLSFDLDRSGFDDVAQVLDRLKHFRIAVSWGGVESVAISPRRQTGTEGLDRQRLPHGLIRLSVGLEGAHALIEDIRHALADD
jgi:cystathionine beta-lyase/cystathionine gamma-synthase